MSSCSTCIHQMGNIPFWFYLSVHVLTLIGVWKNAEKRNLIFCTRYYGQPVRARAPRPAYLSAAPSVSGKSQGTNYFQDPTRVARTTARHHAAGVATAHPQERGCAAREDPGVGKARASRVPERRARGDGRGGPEVVFRPELQWLALRLLHRGGEGVGGARIPQVSAAIHLRTLFCNWQEGVRALASRRGIRAAHAALPNFKFSRSTAHSPCPR